LKIIASTFSHFGIKARRRKLKELKKSTKEKGMLEWGKWVGLLKCC
jgi:hypothetical protein